MTAREVSSERVSEERLTPEQLLEWASDTNNPLFDYDRVPDHLISGAIALARELLTLRSSVRREAPAAASEVTLEDLFRSTEGVDRNQPGYHHMCGWNDAIRHVMHLTAALKGGK